MMYLSELYQPDAMGQTAPARRPRNKPSKNHNRRTSRRVKIRTDDAFTRHAKPAGEMQS